MLSSPKGIAIAVFLLAVAVISVLGGALGAAFGGGFIGGAVPHLQVPSELVAYIGDYPLYNTVVMFAAAIVVLVLLTWLATRKISEVPGTLASVDGDPLRVLHRAGGIYIWQGGTHIHTRSNRDLLGGAVLKLARGVARNREHRPCRDDNGVFLPQV